MHLKSIELVGFKSFADKTFIELKPGVSAIVGPNGCGKSNIVDALRWCLGEMSAKSLRSKQMLDVLFSGASGRAALNLAEVTLTFDNSHHLLPIDFNEVQVTRRLFRSGESEYYLNKTQCRLKDIRDLFLDTGLGEGYSILAQGEVDFVINAKAEERRELFEEAAGISRYKARREEALRKLEKVELDFQRLNDLIAMVKEQMDSLEAAARKARLYQKVREELKQMEIADWLYQLLQFDEKIGVTQKRKEELQADVQKATTELDCAETDITAHRVQQDACERALYEKNKAAFEVDKQVAAADQTIQNEREKVLALEQQIARGRERIQSDESGRADLRGKIAQIETEIAHSQKDLAALRQSFNAGADQWKSLEKERRALEKSKEELARALFDVAAEIAEAHNAKNHLISQEVHKRSEIATGQKELQRSQDESRRLEEEIAAQTAALKGLAESANRFEAQTNESKQTLESQLVRQQTLSRTLQNLLLELTQNETQHRLIQEEFESDPHRRGTQKLLQQNPPGLRGMVGLLFQYSEGAAHWVEQTLGPRSQYLVFDELSQAQAALDWLRENKFGRATCVVLEKLPAVQAPELSSIPNANALTAFVHCAPELEPLKRALLGSAFVAGQQLYDRGTVEGGSDPEPRESGGAAPARNDFRLKADLEAAIQRNRASLSAAEKEHLALKEETALSEAALAEARMNFEKVQLQRDHLEQILERKREELDLARREAALLEERAQGLSAELESLKTDLRAEEEKLAALAQSQSAKEAERRELEAKIESQREKERRAEVAAKEKEIRLETFEQQFRQKEALLAEWRDQSDRFEKEVAETRAEIESASLRIAESRKRQQEEESSIQTLQAQKTEISAQAESLIQEKSQWEEKTQALEGSLSALREKQARLTEMLHEADLDLRMQESEKKNVAQRMLETYQIAPEQADPALAPEAADPEELQKMKRRVETMSHSVNLEAPEQHQALLERYNFLSTQTEDLMKAREDLKNAIQQINATTKEQFKQTFEKVRENFRAIYATLFAGGEADLVFTNAQDLLETGIDIVAQPPGKKLQNIALLSGGERALTAIALLFAFFMVKPSPFCILDEVDAPWDPANVARFLNLLREFAQKTQFLVVTHNPRTMEIADVLYGVTMQEFGISKILSARLKKEPEEAQGKLELAPA